MKVLMQRWFGRLAPMLWPLLAAACSQGADWRLLQPPGTHLSVAMPCRPASLQRELTLAQRLVALRLWACETPGTTVAIGHAELADPASTAAVMAALADAARRNVDGVVELEEPLAVPGMTPHQGARRLRLAGRLPDGRRVTSWVSVFAYGQHVYQATVIGAALDDALVQHFHSSLAIRP